VVALGQKRRELSRHRRRTRVRRMRRSGRPRTTGHGHSKQDT
jgi:hypothetical protein